MTIEGELVVRLDWDGRSVRRVSIRSTRPLATSRVLAGRRASEAAELVPRLYSVCACAQGAAAAAAIEGAMQRSVSPATTIARDRAIALESLQEDLRCLLIDLPQAIGQPPQVAPVAELRRAIAPRLDALRRRIGGRTDGCAPPPDDDDAALVDRVIALIDANVFGEAPAAFLSRASARGLRDWTEQTRTAPALVARTLSQHGFNDGASSTSVMPDVDPAALEAVVLPALLAETDFAQAPHWNGEPVETGALARAAAHPAISELLATCGNGIAVRLFARLVQVAQTLEGLRSPAAQRLLNAWSPRDGDGVAAVQTARGLLLHYARVSAEVVRAYAIVAPTEWNFHPHGALARGVAGMRGEDRETLARDAGLLVQMLDPCVAYRVEVGHA